MTSHRARRLRFGALAAAAVVAAPVIWNAAQNSASATHQPADKVAASGSDVLVTDPGTAITILKETLRTSSPADLILGVTLECSIATDLTTVGNDSEQAEGRVRVWVEIDGKPVPVAGEDDGRVTFCNQAYHRDTTNFDDEDATIRTYLLTAAANGFNWLALNLGNGIHTVEVKAELTETATNENTADAAIGRRTLMIEPVKAANDETTTDL